MADEKNKWNFNRQLNLSVLVQLIFLASLIIGTWVNIQRQLCLVQHDIERLIESHKTFQQKFEILNNMCIGYEYRLRALETSQEQLHQ